MKKEELHEMSKLFSDELKTIFRMIAAGANAGNKPFASSLQTTGLLPEQYSSFQIGLKVGGLLSAETIATVVVNKDGTGKINIGVNCCRTAGRYESLFFSKADIAKELQVIEYFLKRNFI